MNLQNQMSAITRGLAKGRAHELDSALSSYLSGAINLLEAQGKDITKYSLVQITNPMAVEGSKVVVSSQWRVVPIEQLVVVPQPAEKEGE